MHYNYHRRPTAEVRVGGITIGGDAPIVVQSMTNISTNDVAGCVEQIERLADAGADLVRLTTQGVREAENLGLIREELRHGGLELPLSADVHFNPKAAFAAASRCEKVRINPGNFVDAARTFRHLEYTDEEYAAELERIRTALVPFLQTLRENDTALRLGVNHGSLSDRIMSRYGDTPAGMVESVMEYLRICRRENFDRIVISLKSSNTAVMVQSVRLLVEAMDAEDMHFPLHLGVTEAGDGAEARIKSAVGIGTLLADGLGDTIRVSLSEEPEAEIPVARALIDYISSRRQIVGTHLGASSFHGGEDAPRCVPTAPVVVTEMQPTALHADAPDMRGWHRASATDEPQLYADTLPVILRADMGNAPGSLQLWIDRFRAMGGSNPIVAEVEYTDEDLGDVQLKAAADLGPVLINGRTNSLSIIAPMDTAETELMVLQAARVRFSKTEYIACPGCGRTLFDLQGTLAAVKAATAHLPAGVKIAVMGCIVNGPGEMSDADYGYVGAAAGRVSLYRGRQCVEKNIPQHEAIPRLLALIEADQK